MPSTPTATYQVKLRLDPAAVLQDGELRQTVTKQFKIFPSNRRSVATYLDTTRQELRDSGRIIRAKQTVGRNRVVLNYKTRIPLGQIKASKRRVLPKSALNKAIKRATKQGLTPGSVSMEVELSYRNAVVDFSSTHRETGITLKKAHRVPVSARAPKSFTRATGRKRTQRLIGAATSFGPVWTDYYPARALRYDLTVEVVHFPARGNRGAFHYVEVTADYRTIDQAERARADLIAYFDKAGILLAEDAFKTDLVAQHFGAA